MSGFDNTSPLDNVRCDEHDEPAISFLKGKPACELCLEEAEDVPSDDDPNTEYRLRPGSMCVHHEDEPAVTILDDDPLCEQCRDDYIDSYQRGD